LPFEEFEKWKDTANILKNEKLNSLLLRYCDAPRADYEDLCKDVESVTTAAGVMLSPESIILNVCYVNQIYEVSVISLFRAVYGIEVP